MAAGPGARLRQGITSEQDTNYHSFHRHDMIAFNLHRRQDQQLTHLLRGTLAGSAIRNDDRLLH